MLVGLNGLTGCSNAVDTGLIIRRGRPRVQKPLSMLPTTRDRWLTVLPLVQSSVFWLRSCWFTLHQGPTRIESPPAHILSEQSLCRTAGKESLYKLFNHQHIHFEEGNSIPGT